MEAPPHREIPTDMGGVQQGRSGSVCVSRDVSLSTLVLPWLKLHLDTFPPNCSAPRSYGKSLPGQGPSQSARQSVVFGSCVSPQWLSLGDSDQDGPSVPDRGLNTSPLPITVEAVGLASKGGPAHSFWSLN